VRGSSEEGSEGERQSGKLEIVSQALNPLLDGRRASDRSADSQLSAIEEDARAEEIALFVREKTELARRNRSITNPTGLILGVPSIA
jgi:hypothetical protein